MIEALLVAERNQAAGFHCSKEYPVSVNRFGRNDVAGERPRRLTITHAERSVLRVKHMLGVRLDRRTDRMLAALARQQRTTKSALVREAIERYIAATELARQAREQSLRASKRVAPALEHDDREWTA